MSLRLVVLLLVWWLSLSLIVHHSFITCLKCICYNNVAIYVLLVMISHTYIYILYFFCVPNVLLLLWLLVVLCFVVIASFCLPQILEFMVPNFVLLGEIEIGDLSFLRWTRVFFLGIPSPIIVVSHKHDTYVTHVLFASCGLSFSYIHCFDCSKPSLLP